MLITLDSLICYCCCYCFVVDIVIIIVVVVVGGGGGGGDGVGVVDGYDYDALIIFNVSFSLLFYLTWLISINVIYFFFFSF